MPVSQKKAAVSSPQDQFFNLFKKNLEDDHNQTLKPEELESALAYLWKSFETRKRDDIDVAVSSWEPENKSTYWPERTRIALICKERPFLVDSITAELHARGLMIKHLSFPVMETERDKQNNLVSVDACQNEDQCEVVMYIVLQGHLDKAQCKDLTEKLTTIVKDITFATDDWKPMLARIRESVANVEILKPKLEKKGYENIDEVCQFLKYLGEGNFTLLGIRDYKFAKKGNAITSSVLEDENLGVLKDARKPVYINKNKTGLTQSQQKMRFEGPLLSITKVNRKSTVHRHVPLDAIFLKLFDKSGRLIGERLFIGLFTSVTYSRSVSDVPMIRQKVENVVNQSGFSKSSHEYRALRHILEKYPRDELFQISAEKLTEHCIEIMRLQDTPRVALFTRFDPFLRYVSSIVYVPRDRFDSRLRQQYMDILATAFGGEAETFFTTLDDSPLARVLIIIRTDDNKMPDVDLDELERQIIRVSESWAERLQDFMVHQGTDSATQKDILRNYGEAFPILYCDKNSAATALLDIERIEQAFADPHEMSLELYRPSGMKGDKLRLKMYRIGDPLPLSEVLPIIEHFGLRVVSEIPYQIMPSHKAQSVWIHDFLLEISGQTEAIQIQNVKARFEDAFMQVWTGKVDDDSLNSLVLNGGLEWRPVTVIRSYISYMHQARYPFTPHYIREAVTDHPKIVAQIFALFEAKFKTDNNESDIQCAGCRVALDHLLEDVVSLDQDQILRVLMELVEKTLRTNYYQRDENGQVKDWISYKLDSSKISILPKPKPMAEIFVFSSYMEGVHLRGGEIARGGIRWSDRREDFRTEILGLMKAQMVKNAVIIPVGAKGGFILKQPPAPGDREAFKQEGIRCYQTLIRGMLDITDNLVGDTIVKPDNVVCLDGDDPYLVVAADKGTATFSDIANALSIEYGFWMHDAFASGGSNGYDHKKMGITAKGAWESVKRHFREMGRNIQEEDFEVVGIGDMGGDVFGNGMLLSEHIRLIAAFNHLHIFCDPDPDIAKSYKERQRLFDEAKGWDQYNTKLLSKGGRIYNRSDKLLELTPEIRKRFNIEEKKVSPVALIRKILQTKADLLWLGGIGTYIRSENENNTEVGDKANDALRVTNEDIRFTVIGEGANLGITPAARIKLAQQNVRLNADYIDNSGGVDCSDHEVNIKILMSAHVQDESSKFSMEDRNALLESMTDDVAGLVLRNNYQQTQAISLAELSAASRLNDQNILMRLLEKENGMDRTLERLPDEKEVARRLKQREGLTRPELGTLICWSKIRLFQKLLESDLPDDSVVETWLVRYFPEELLKRFNESILNHRLRREIVSTQIASSIVNRQGPAFVLRMAQNSNASEANTARACFLSRECFHLKALLNKIESYDNQIDAVEQLKALRAVAALSERTTLWFLNNSRVWSKGQMSEVREEYRDAIKTISGSLKDILPKESYRSYMLDQKTWSKKGYDADTASWLASLPTLTSACDIINISRNCVRDVAKTAKVYFRIGDVFAINWLMDQARALANDSSWEYSSAQSLINGFEKIHAALTTKLFEDENMCPIDQNDSEKTMPDLDGWLAHIQSRNDIFDILEDLKQQESVDLAMLVVAEQRLRKLSGL